MSQFAAVVLAGGAGRRMGGRLKPAVPVHGRAMVDRVLAAVPSAAPRVVVGPRELLPYLPPGVVLTQESPAGGGPVAAIGAGVATLTGLGDEHDRDAWVAIVAGDLPFLTAGTVELLRRTAVAGQGGGAVLVDPTRRIQWLCGVWPLTPVRHQLLRLGTLAGRATRELLGDLGPSQVAIGTPGPPPWFDCDTEDDLRRAEEWSHGDAG
ncbi:MAG TPA: NTP transferase domain-containing protein [Micromonosporaceae bacterium]